MDTYYVRIYNMFLTQRRIKLPSIPERIMERAGNLPEGAPLCPNAFLDLGKRAAIDQAFSRLARAGRLMRICQGVYVLPVHTRFGDRPPSLQKVVDSWTVLFEETIVPSGGSAANAFGLTTQVPVKQIYLTSGPDRELSLGELKVTLRHATRWQLTAPRRPAGDAVRAMSWIGRAEAREALEKIEKRLSSEDLSELAEKRAVMPDWMAETVSERIARA